MASFGGTNVPLVALALIASYLPFQDRLSFSEQCRGARDAVEDHCEKLLNHIVEKHGVDDAFQDRIHDRSNVVTTRQNPELPKRYLLWMAMRTHLYEINNQEDDEDGWHPTYCDFLCLPKDRIAIVADNEDVEIWSLATKEHLQTLDCARKMFLVDGRLVLDSLRECCIWADETTDNNGGWSKIGRTEKWDFRNNALVPYERELLYMPDITRGVRDFVWVGSKSHVRSVNCFNVKDGTWDHRFALPESLRSNSVEMLVCNRKWLLIHVLVGADSELSSIFYVYDLDTNEMTHEFQRDAPLTCGHIFQSSVESKTICALSLTEPCIFVFDMDDNGRLSERPMRYYVHEHDPDNVRGMNQDWLARELSFLVRKVTVFQSHMVVLIDRECKVYNAETGTLERTWECPEGQQAVICPKRNELLIKSGGVAVKAYCLEEPHL